MKSPIVLLRDLFSDLKRLNPGVKGVDRDLVTIDKRFENEGYGFLTVALPALDAALLRGLSSGQFTCPKHFKTVPGGTIPRFLSGMFCKVFDPLTGRLVEDPDLGIITDLHQVLLLFKKTQLSPENEEYLHSKAVSEFYQCDDVAKLVTMPDRHDHLIGRVCKMLLNTLNVKDVENASYKHGPGAVKEGYKANQKWKALFSAVERDDRDLQSAGIWGIGENRSLDTSRPSDIRGSQSGLLLSYGVRISAFYNRLRSCRNDRANDSLGQSLIGETINDGSSSSSAKLITVAKNSSSRRTITVEPMLKQYVQQGLNTLLRDSIKECRVLRECIALTDQSKNQVLALEGSLTDKWATIDLKSASDLLSVSLVKSVFRHHPDFFGHMMACRSPNVQTEGKPLLTLGKFAGMGNALTFPVQSICYAVVCIAAILDSEGSTPSYGKVMRAARRLRVFGDDVIVDTKYVHQCVNWLERVGLRVNVNKSFLAGNFKESCGVDAFKGVDITPLYCRHRPDTLSDASPNVIASIISLSNHLWMKGLYSASTCLKNEVEKALGKALPLVSRDSGSFGWHTRLDAMTAHKWCRRTHRFMTRTLALAPIKRDDRLDGYAALLKCLSMSRGVGSYNTDSSHKEHYERYSRSLFPEPMAMDKDHLSKTSIRYRNRIKQRWVPSLSWGGINL